MKKYFTMITMMMALIAAPVMAHAADNATLIAQDEKLAPDVYQKLYQRWQHPVFLNISQSESRHLASVERLRGAALLISAAGKFSDPDTQSLYNNLMTKGEKSLIDALQVGATIEDKDIFDLNNAIASSNNPREQQVYNNLLRGSYKHLNAFVRTLHAEGSDYQAHYLSQKDYDEILNNKR